REQIKAIHEELGDDVNEIEELREKILNKKMEKEQEEKVLSELKRMSKMMPSSPDYTVLRSYIDWVLDVPFKIESKDTEKISDVRKVLEKDHFGLEKVKERIIEYLSVLKLTKSLKGPILCLVGPPGVGKTSVAKSVARALNRKLVRMSLGGVKDEAEIRGHRKTYIGAMPGRIIFGMKEAGVINPVFLLDEIDKLSSDLRGDPASALLEVLDPEQNATFRDRYLEIPYDLSKVMFITTANSIDTIPAPLLDRMEVIDIAGYTEEEKIQIAKRYLVPKAIEANGLTKNNVKFLDSGIREIINGYTGEAGVRKLEQSVNAVVRKIATKVAENSDSDKKVIDKKTVATYLGANRYSKDMALESNQVGSATGLAWTSIGGVALTIEVAVMKGKGNLLLTGKLGDVMQESAKTAISYIRANAEDYGIDSSVFENNDVHIHVPEGATPKDGPSAGITIATALLSAFTGKKVRRNIAMTGEITLRGNVLAIGGLKEKSLAGFRLGIRKIIIPKRNLKDLEEVPKEISSKLEFIAVENVKEVFEVAIEG
ncbi:MAG: endopeptidase La, partial [Clostridia bacterium]|nr:endopeptidase La [Clostridia bacterium]